MNYLVGTHGTGKSTLLENLRKEMPNLFTTDGFSRPIKTVKNKFNFSTDLEQALINELTKWSWLNNKDNPNFISTRSIIDAIVYSEVFNFECSELRQCFEENYSKEQKYFYIPIEFKIVDDGIRFQDSLLQQEIDKKILVFLNEYNIPYTLIKGSVKKRTVDMIKYLKK